MNNDYSRILLLLERSAREPRRPNAVEGGPRRTHEHAGPNSADPPDHHGSRRSRAYLDSWNRDEAFASLGESGTRAIDPSPSRHQGMHRTQTVDYAFVISGEIWAVLDTAEVAMRAGDVLIQRGTNHAWSNRSDASALVGFVLIDAAAPLAGTVLSRMPGERHGRTHDERGRTRAITPCGKRKGR